MSLGVGTDLTPPAALSTGSLSSREPLWCSITQALEAVVGGHLIQHVFSSGSPRARALGILHHSDLRIRNGSSSHLSRPPRSFDDVPGRGSRERARKEPCWPPTSYLRRFSSSLAPLCRPPPGPLISVSQWKLDRLAGRLASTAGFHPAHHQSRASCLASFAALHGDHLCDKSAGAQLQPVGFSRRLASRDRLAVPR